MSPAHNIRNLVSSIREFLIRRIVCLLHTINITKLRIQSYVIIFIKFNRKC